MPPEPLDRFQTRIRAATAVITAAVGCSLLFQDWGPGNVFSPIRPAIKRYLSSVFGVQPAAQPGRPPAAQPSKQAPA